MSETKKDTKPIEPAEVVPPAKRRFSLTWMVPIAAVGVTLWLLISSYLERGKEIEITFESADGVVSGKTPIRYRRVTVGRVESVSLSDGLDRVVVTARIDRTIAKELGEGSRFWVVKPRIGAGGISGLDTLLSGAFIELDPKAGDRATKLSASSSHRRRQLRHRADD